MVEENISLKNLKALEQDVVRQPELSILDTLLQPDESVRQAPKEEASNTPGGRALASAVAAGVVFTPLVGLAIGGAVHMMQKKKDQNLLDRLELDNKKLAGGKNLLLDSIDLRQEEVNDLRATTQNDNDIEQLNSLDAGLDVVRLLSSNADPAQQQAAHSMLAKHDEIKTQYIRQNELDAVKLAVQSRAEERQLGLDRTKQLNDIRARYDPKADKFEEITSARNKAISALSAENFSYADAHQGVVAYFKTGDPESAVLGPEFEVGSNLGDLFTKVLSTMNSLFTGQAMTTKQRREMIRAIERSYQQAVEVQNRHESKSMRELSDENFPESKNNYFQTIDRMPQVNFPVIQPDALERGEATKETLKAIVKSIPGREAAQQVSDAAIDAADDLVVGMRRFQEDIKASGLRPMN